MNIAVTGGYATGKTTVVRILKELGAKVYYADKISREAVRPKTKAWTEIVKYFGKDILFRNNRINREKLADIVFSNSRKRRKLNDITHKVIVSKIKSIISSNFKAKSGTPFDLSDSGDGVAVGGNLSTKNLVIEVPLLFETGIEKLFDIVIVVVSPLNVQKERILNRDAISERQVLLRINSQMDIKKKKKKANYVINNNKTMTMLRKKTKEVWNRINHE